MPPNPKRIPNRRSGLPFDDAEILKADDPRPQRVPQYPSTGMKRPMKKAEEAIPTSVFDTEQHDEEMRATYTEGDKIKPAFLYVERGPGAGQLVQLKPGPLVIGRASVADLRLQHPSISRRHAQFKRIGEQFFVKDLGSQNGTFVNKSKLETEVEVFPGDLIAMGNALLKLRGPMAKGEALPPPQKNSVPKKALKTAVVSRTPPPKTTSVMKVAIFAAAIGAGVTGVFVFALLKPSAPPARAERPAVEVKSKAAPVAEAVSIDVDEVKVKQAKQVDDAIAAKMKEKQAAAAVVAAEKKAAADKEEAQAAPADGDDKKVPKPLAVAKGIVASKKAASEDTEDEAPAAKPKKTTLLAQYEKGNAEASLEAAKKANDRELVAKLTDFMAVYEAADAAVNQNNGSAAIKNYEKALKLDEALSSGFGVYGSRIRKQLSNLYTLVGLQHIKNDNPENAKIAFQAALKNDPDNDRAKAQLSRLGASKASSADDAFSDDEKPAPVKKKAPAKKPAAEPKSRSQAIDDAFGD